MTMARSVTGDVDVSLLHDVDAHEHLFLDLGCSVPNRAELLLQSEDEAVDELTAYAAAGGGAVVCATPTGLGRRPEQLRSAAERTDVTVLATGGFHKLAYYPPGHWVHEYPLTVIADLVHEEVMSGIDRYDYAGPHVDRTSVRPGVLKAGSDFHRFRGREAALHRLVAETAAATGLPVLLHVELGAAPHLALDEVEKAGLPLDRVLVSHLDRNPDAALHVEVAQRGAYLVYDGLYRETYRPTSVVLDLVGTMADAGQGERLLLGGDLAPRAYRRVAGAPGLAGLRSLLVARLVDRFGGTLVDQLVTGNARRALALAGPGVRETHSAGDV